MMIYLYLKQTVVDYARWKEGFDTHLSARQAGGATAEALVLRNVDNPHEIIVLLGWRDLHQARTFSQSVSLQMALKTMGVVGVPEVRFLETAVCVGLCFNSIALTIGDKHPFDVPRGSQ